MSGWPRGRLSGRMGGLTGSTVSKSGPLRVPACHITPRAKSAAPPPPMVSTSAGQLAEPRRERSWARPPRMRARLGPM
eukprot:56953-Chlamydomonas_euryale.AAC.1